MEGVVVSDKMDKTRTVRVTRTVKPSFLPEGHDQEQQVPRSRRDQPVPRGRQVEITSTRPLSKLKRWRLVRVVKAAPRAAEAK